jgi:hypothetical protein
MTVMDRDTLSNDDVVGIGVYILDDLFRTGKYHGPLDLHYKGKKAGTITFEATFTPNTGY